jgi:hypothetical protein
MKHPIFKQLAPNTRRKFLHLAAAPVSSLLLAACGGGAAAAETDLPRVPPHAPPPATGTLPDWVATLPLWQWHEIPNTALSSVAPAVPSLGNPRSKINAWCGACLKRRGSVYMLGAAGGHSDYAGNEVDALALNVATPRWTQLRGPTRNTDIINGSEIYLDMRPAATHTYYATQFIESLDRMIVFVRNGLSGKFPAPPRDWPYLGANGRSKSFNVATGDWDPPDYVARFPVTGDLTSALCIKHPWTDDVYLSLSYGSSWYRWASATNTWSKLSRVSRASWSAGAAIDPQRNRMLIVGGYSPLPPEVRNFDGSKVAVEFTGMGAASLALSGYPSVIYDETMDRYIVAFNSGASIKILRVHPETWHVDEPAMTRKAPTARTNGLQNAMQYVPELRGFVVANRYDGNVYFVRTKA